MEFHRIFRSRGVCFALSAVLLAGLFAVAAPPAPGAAAAAPKTFMVAQAERMALAASPEIKKTYNEILLKQMKYTEAVNGMRLKAKNKQTLRWSPLLSFKLPEKLNLQEEFDLSVKPLALTAEITTLQHRMNDERFAVLSKVRNAFLEVYAMQEKSAFTEEMLAAAQDDLSRNRARLALGQANQNDIDVMEQTVSRLAETLAQQKRTFQSAKGELTDIIKLDVTSGYRFLSPLATAEISREQLEQITDYTLANDQEFYEARAAESLATVNLNTYEKLMRGQYGGNMNRLNSFISAARQGEDIDYSAFKMQYDALLTAVDAPWAGRLRILFFSFSREFLKGQISGTRYIEDEMYALYTACMEYAAARKDRISAEASLRKQVASDFEALVTARNAANALIRTTAVTRDQLDRVTALNKVGKAEYSEVKDKIDDYQGIQMDALDAMTTYNQMMIEFDRLSCGAVTAYLHNMSLETDAGAGAISLPAEDGKAYYYIYGDVADLTFVFGLEIPDGFEPDISEYEIWYEGTQIGEHTPADRQIRHLTLVYGESDMLTVRLYDSGGSYAGECEIDVTVPRDVLPIGDGEETAAPSQADTSIGTYRVATRSVGDVSLSTLTLEFTAVSGARYYRLQYGGADVYTAELTAAEEDFDYLTLLIANLGDVKLLVYDRNRQQIWDARFDISDQSIKATAV
jgi:hypothetical protein